jgi:hypothetical protein
VRGIRLLPGYGNAARRLVVKQNYWTWNEKNTAGNAIDFFTAVEQKSFHDAMRIIHDWQDYDSARQHLREECGTVAEIAR